LTRTNIDAKALLNQKLKAKRITDVEFYEIKENNRLKIRDDTEDHTKGVNGDKMDTNVTEQQKKDQENNNTGFGKVQNNKRPNAEEEQNTAKNKLKEDLQIMGHKVRLLQISESKKLPKL
jgi:hypothetical protein